MATGRDFEYEFVEELATELICSICMKVLNEPHLINCCEQQFCKKCLDKWLAQNHSCPHCRSRDFSSILLKQKSRKIGELKVYCPNKQHGCLSTLKITEYDNHLSTTNDEGCLYVKLSCPNDCKTTLFRCKLKIHYCPRRRVTCSHCNIAGEYQHIVGDHTKTCPTYPLTCPQKCGAKVLRKDMEAHRDTCPLEVIACSFSELGCKTKVCRKDLEKHVESSLLQHVTELAKSHAALAKSHAALEEKIKFIGSIIRQIPLGNESGSVQIPQIYTIVTDTSELIVDGGPLKLGFSEFNKKSGHHYIIASEQKFKLEWNSPEQNTHQRNYANFKLYSVQNDGPEVLLPLPLPNAEITISAMISRNVCNLAIICCGKPQTLSGGDVSSDKSLQLLGTAQLDWQQSASKQIEIRFKTHQQGYQQHETGRLYAELWMLSTSRMLNASRARAGRFQQYQPCPCKCHLNE